MIYESVTDIGLPQVPSNVDNDLIQRELDLLYQAIHNLNAALIGGNGGTPGIGDVVADSASSAINGLVVYSSLDGKHISITLSSGIPLLINGVLSIAVPGVGNDYLAGDTQHDNIQGIDTGDVQHLTAAVKTDLTDGGDSALHYHLTDRIHARNSALHRV